MIIVEQSGKRCQNIFYWVKKMTCLGVLDRNEQDDDNETGLKEEGEIEMSIYKCSIRDARSFALNTYISFLTATAMTPTHSMARPLKFF